MKNALSLATALFLAACGMDTPTAGRSAQLARTDGKITICHHTHSEKNPTVTITVSTKSWPAHESHGDSIGGCDSAVCVSPGEDCNDTDLLCCGGTCSGGVCMGES